MTPIVNIRDAIKDYPLGKTTVRALHGINLVIGTGEFTAIAGPSGSGKTTLLNLIGCVDTPTEGLVEVAGSNVAELNERDRTNLRLEHLGFIFQSFNLIPVLTVFQNVEFPLLLQKKWTAPERKERTETILERVGLSDQIAKRPNELSGGQRQRVAIARALVTRPSLVLADEPTANLDSKTGQTILDLMRRMNEEENTTFIFSTHDQRVMDHARRLVSLGDGLIENDQILSQRAAS